MISRRLPAALALVCAVLLGSCSKPARTVILITLDTTRADRLGCYGYRQGHTPVLDGLAGEAVLFEQAHAPVPVTLPSHTSMFTGEYPPLHGVRYNGMFHVADATVTLAERLKDAGFRTGAIPAAYPVARETGLAQGFEVYRDLFAETEGKLPVGSERKAEQVTQLGMEWLRGVGEGRAFLWLHYFDPHAPYAPPFPYSAQFRERPYDGEVAYMDQALGTLVSELKAMGRWDDAVVLVAGDHGEGLYEHGEVAHSDLVYQSTIHVPLLVKAPGARPRRVPDPVSLVDVAPTLLELAGLKPPPMAGRSLVPALRGKALPPRPLYFESLADSLLYGWSPLEGVRRGSWKYIRSSTPELYDLGSDPGERTDRSRTDRDVAEDMAAELTRLEGSWSGKEGSAANPTPMDPQQLAMLASLGYVGGAVSTERRDGRNPRDGVHLIRGIAQGRDLMEAHQPGAALEAWKAVLDEDPDNRFVLLESAHASIAMGDFEGAQRFAEHLVRVYPEFAPGAIVLGELWVRRGEPARAVEVFKAASAHHPEDQALSYRHALALLASGRAADARKTLDPMIEAEPDTGSLWLARGAARAREGDAAGAAADLAEGVRRGYDDPEVLATEPLLAPLRALPAYPAALAKVQAAAAAKGSK
jgi:arylsulfatase A-like enzyme/Flp pilus assembly protein TadD